MFDIQPYLKPIHTLSFEEFEKLALALNVELDAAIAEVGPRPEMANEGEMKRQRIALEEEQRRLRMIVNADYGRQSAAQKADNCISEIDAQLKPIAEIIDKHHGKVRAYERKVRNAVLGWYVLHNKLMATPWGYTYYERECLPEYHERMVRSAWADDLDDEIPEANLKRYKLGDYAPKPVQVEQNQPIRVFETHNPDVLMIWLNDRAADGYRLISHVATFDADQRIVIHTVIMQREVQS